MNDILQDLTPFLLTPAHSLGIRDKRLWQDLQNPVPVELGIGGSKDPHTSLAELF